MPQMSLQCPWCLMLLFGSLLVDICRDGIYIRWSMNKCRQIVDNLLSYSGMLRHRTYMNTLIVFETKSVGFVKSRPAFKSCEAQL